MVKRVLAFAYEKGYMQNSIILKNRIKNKSSKSIKALDKEEQQKLEDYIFINKKTNTTCDSECLLKENKIPPRENIFLIHYTILKTFLQLKRSKKWRQ